MGSLSDYSEDKLLDHTVGNTAYTPVATVYLALSTADPTDDNSGIAEPVGGSYARKALTFSAASSRTVVQTGDVTFDTATGAWGTITHYAIFDALTNGNMLAHGTISPSKDITSGKTPRIVSGDIAVSFLTGGVTTYLADAS